MIEWSQLGFQGLDQVLNVHPVFVHFPVALFPTALLCYTIGILRHQERFLFAGRMVLSLAAISALVAILTGLAAEDTFPHSETLHRMMETHETIGSTVTILAGFLWVWSFIDRAGIPKWPILFLAALLATTLLVFQNGDLGGRMVFVEGAAVMEHDHHEDHPHRHYQ